MREGRHGAGLLDVGADLGHLRAHGRHLAHHGHDLALLGLDLGALALLCGGGELGLLLVRRELVTELGVDAGESLLGLAQALDLGGAVALTVLEGALLRQDRGHLRGGESVRHGLKLHGSRDGLASLGSSDAIAILGGLGARGQRVRVGVNPAEMLVEILQAREALAGVSLAVSMRTVERVAGTAVLGMDLALVAEQAAAVSEARKLLTALG